RGLAHRTLIGGVAGVRPHLVGGEHLTGQVDTQAQLGGGGCGDVRDPVLTRHPRQPGDTLVYKPRHMGHSFTSPGAGRISPRVNPAPMREASPPAARTNPRRPPPAAPAPAHPLVAAAKACARSAHTPSRQLSAGHPPTRRRPARPATRPCPGPAPRR